MPQKLSNFALACTLVLILFLSGCASGPELENYPRRQIDRPYTLPHGVANWQQVMTVQASSIQPSQTNPAGNSNTTIDINPLIWQQSLSDDWNLLWLPLPTQVLHQFAKTKTDMLGFSAGVNGFLHSSANGFYLSTTASFLERHTFSQSFAVDINPLYQEDIAFQDGQSSTWLASLEFAPFFQLTDELSLQPGFALSWNHGQAPGIYTLGSSDVLPDDTTQFTLPLTLTASWSIDRHWDLTASYGYYGIGYDDGFKSHVGTLIGAYYW